MKLKLHRGIAVEGKKVDSVLESIRRNGITGDVGQWSLSIPNVSEVRKRLNVLFSSNDTSRDDIFEDTRFKGICACGDEYEARYYAQRHNITDDKATAILINFTASISRVYVDCRDFL